MTSTKVCIKCKEEKELSEFYFRKDQKSYRTDCKKCHMQSKNIKEKRFLNKENFFKYLLIVAKNRAKKKGIEFNLDLKWMYENVPNVCPVFNTSLRIGSKNPYEMISIDRLDCNKGYTKDNCKIMSWRANCIKNNSTLTELRKLVQYLENNQ